jgi:hypothetical protein
VTNDFPTLFKHGVYFHAVGGPLTHNAGCLIEGMLELGVPVKLCGPQITSRPVSMPLAGVDLTPHIAPMQRGMSAYIVDISHTNAIVPVENVEGRVAYLNQSDIAAFGGIPDHETLFVTHASRFVHKGGTRHPLAFGLSRGLIAATDNRTAFAQRQRKALRNFRATLSQSLRGLLDITYVPALETQLPVDRTLAAPAAYLQSLLNSAVCLAYGGDFYTPIGANPWFKQNDPNLAAVHDFQRFDAPAAILRWDSFRLWESFAAGCLTVHLDFEKYGFQLPHNPVAWEHYAPIDLGNIAGSVEELMDRVKEWPDIAERGRAWAIKHYAPRPVAEHVLGTMLKSP